MQGSRPSRSRAVTPLLGLKLFVGRIICSKWIGIAIGRVFADRIPFHGIRVSVGEMISPKNKALLFWGLYESAEYRFIRDYLVPHLPVIEAGAGIGAITSVIARILEPSQQIVCIEGNPNILPLLRRNLTENASHLKWTVVEGAVGAHTESIAFEVAENNLCSTASQQPRAHTQAITVPCVPVSSVLSQVNWQGGYQLVADIEGGEASLLVDDSVALTRCQRVIIELHDTSYHAVRYTIADLQRMIEHRGFTEVARHGAVRVFERTAQG
jgi:FkbM family methyltransferase